MDKKIEDITQRLTRLTLELNNIEGELFELLHGKTLNYDTNPTVPLTQALTCLFRVNDHLLRLFNLQVGWHKLPLQDWNLVKVEYVVESPDEFRVFYLEHLVGAGRWFVRERGGSYDLYEDPLMFTWRQALQKFLPDVSK